MSPELRQGTDSPTRNGATDGAVIPVLESQ